MYVLDALNVVCLYCMQTSSDPHIERLALFSSQSKIIIQCNIKE